jgi:hypothetical protein
MDDCIISGLRKDGGQGELAVLTTLGDLGTVAFAVRKLSVLAPLTATVSSDNFDFSLFTVQL